MRAGMARAPGMRRLIPIIVTFILLLASAAVSMACECRERGTLGEEFARSETVVVAELKSAGTMEEDHDRAEVVFKVERAFKGDYAAGDKIVFRYKTGKNCTMNFVSADAGTKYILYLDAQKKDEIWAPTICSRSGEAKTARADIEAIEKTILRKPARKLGRNREAKSRMMVKSRRRS